MVRSSTPRSPWPVLWLLFLAATLTACSSSAQTDSCGVAGRARSCSCALDANAIGIETCQLNGSWTACQCYSSARTGEPIRAVPTSSAGNGAGATGQRVGSSPVGGAGGAAGASSAPGWFWQVIATPGAANWLSTAGSGG